MAGQTYLVVICSLIKMYLGFGSMNEVLSLPSFLPGSTINATDYNLDKGARAKRRNQGELGLCAPVEPGETPPELRAESGRSQGGKSVLPYPGACQSVRIKILCHLYIHGELV